MTHLYTLQASTGSPLSMIIMIVVMIAIFYFIGIRPQKKQEQAAKQMRDGLAIGDEIVTIGGIIGKIVSKREDAVIIETSSDRTKLKMELRAISHVTKKANEVKENTKPATFKVKK